MSPEKTQLLYERYPTIFSLKDKKEYPVAHSIGCNDGWFNLIDDLCRTLEKIAKAFGVVILVEQVKQKFGSLRFYYIAKVDISTAPMGEIKVSVDPDVRKMIELCVKYTTNQSQNICEITGKEGKIRGDLRNVQCLSVEEYQKALAEGARQAGLLSNIAKIAP